jgi:hypothetical protein
VRCLPTTADSPQPTVAPTIGRDNCGWKDARHGDPDRLAELFLARLPEIAAAGRGSDWLYAGWYIERLHLTYPAAFPIAYADWELPADCLTTIGDGEAVRVPLPPPGEATPGSTGR